MPGLSRRDLARDLNREARQQYITQCKENKTLAKLTFEEWAWRNEMNLYETVELEPGTVHAGAHLRRQS